MNIFEIPEKDIQKTFLRLRLNNVLIGNFEHIWQLFILPLEHLRLMLPPYRSQSFHLYGESFAWLLYYRSIDRLWVNTREHDYPFWIMGNTCLATYTKSKFQNNLEL